MIGVLGGVRSVPGPKFGVCHRFTAYDCEHPILVQALKLPNHCLTQKTMDDTTNQTTDLTTTDNEPYQLLQKATYHEFEAHRCIQTQSRFFYSCVWASHSVMNNERNTRDRTTNSYRIRLLCTGHQDQYVHHRVRLLGTP